MSVVVFVGALVFGLVIGLGIGGTIGYREERRFWATRSSGWVRVTVGAAQNSVDALRALGGHPETIKHITLAIERHWRETGVCR